MTQLDGIVFLGALEADHTQPPKCGRSWSTAIADGVQDHEDRASLRPRAMRSVSWQVVATSLAERVDLEAVIATVLEHGNACAPFWSRGWAVAAFSGSTATLSSPLPVAGDWIHFLDAAGWFCLKVQSMSGATATFTAAAPRAFAGGIARPVIFGRVYTEGLQAIDGEMATATFRVVEPMGIGTRATQSCSAPSCPTAPTSVSMCEPPPSLSITPATQCGQFTLSWATEPAATWKVWSSTASTGPWTLVTTLSAVGYSADVPLRTGRYYTVTVIRGGIESERSNAVFAAGVTLERLMRTLQERRTAGGGAAVNWPDRTLPSAGDPGSYPTDGFYAADIAADGATELSLLQSVFDAFDSGWVEKYLSGDIEGSTTAPTYVYTSAPFDVLPYTVTSADTSMRLLIDLLCVLKRCSRLGDVPTPAEYANWRTAQSIGTNLTSAAAIADMSATFAATTYSENPDGGVIGMFGQTFGFQSPPTPPDINHYCQYQVRRGTVTADLSGFTGSVQIYLVTHPYRDQARWTAYAPTEADGRYHLWRTVSGGAAWESEELNNYAGAVPGFDMPFLLGVDRFEGWMVAMPDSVEVFNYPVIAVKQSWTHLPTP
jgi:hypothetical protein